MGQVLHRSAIRTEAIRRAIQQTSTPCVSSAPHSHEMVRRVVTNEK